MFQALFDKFADWLLPFFIGLMIWFGFHYFVLTPRIIKVDQQASFSQDRNLPQTVQSCIKSKIVPSTLDHARMEAALFTASMKYISAPYRNKLNEVESLIDKQCGVTAELAKQAKRRNVIDARDQAINEMKYWFNMLQGYTK